MAASEQLKALVDQMPDPDARGMYCTDIDKEKIEKAIAEIHQGRQGEHPGPDRHAGRARQRGDDVKPHYALHCLANYVLQAARTRRPAGSSAEALASQLCGDRLEVRAGYLCQELQWAGAQGGRARRWASC